MYNPAFDLYHSIFRMTHILSKFDQNEKTEVERLRIWDFYLLFPSEVHNIRLGAEFLEQRNVRKGIAKQNNPYNSVPDGRQFLERLRPYQIGALNYLASIGIIDPCFLLEMQVSVSNKEKLMHLMETMGALAIDENNVLSWFSLYFKAFQLDGEKGLKNRTGLLISKYDGI